MMFRHIFRGSLDKEWLARGAVEAFWRAHARNTRERPPPRAQRAETKVSKRAKSQSETQNQRPLTE